jgi:quinol monooxygenase YgiN
MRTEIGGTMSVTIIYNFQAVHEKAEPLLALLREGRDLGVTVEGCEAFDVYQGHDDPHKFVMVERWTSVQAHQAHFQKNVRASGVLDSVAALMIGPPQGAYYLAR